MHSTHQFWPLDFDQEDEIYENPAWDMPGLRRHSLRSLERAKRPVRQTDRHGR